MWQWLITAPNGLNMRTCLNAVVALTINSCSCVFASLHIVRLQVASCMQTGMRSSTHRQYNDGNVTAAIFDPCRSNNNTKKRTEDVFRILTDNGVETHRNTVITTTYWYLHIHALLKCRGKTSLACILTSQPLLVRQQRLLSHLSPTEASRIYQLMRGLLTSPTITTPVPATLMSSISTSMAAYIHPYPAQQSRLHHHTLMQCTMGTSTPIMHPRSCHLDRRWYRCRR